MLLHAHCALPSRVLSDVKVNVLQRSTRSTAHPAQQHFRLKSLMCLPVMNADECCVHVQGINIAPQGVSIAPTGLNVGPQGASIGPTLIAIGPYDTTVAPQVRAYLHIQHCLPMPGPASACYATMILSAAALLVWAVHLFKLLILVVTTLQVMCVAPAAVCCALQHVQLTCNGAESMRCHAGSEHCACADQHQPGQDRDQPYRPPEGWRLTREGRCARPAQPAGGSPNFPGMNTGRMLSYEVF